jgi:hypothetical protein
MNALSWACGVGCRGDSKGYSRIVLAGDKWIRGKGCLEQNDFRARRPAEGRAACKALD